MSTATDYAREERRDLSADGARRREMYGAPWRQKTIERRIKFAGREHQWREIHAVHENHISLALSYYGDGRTVMEAAKGRKPTVLVFGETGEHPYLHLPFRYEDYFSDEQLGHVAPAFAGLLKDFARASLVGATPVVA